MATGPTVSVTFVNSNGKEVRVSSTNPLPVGGAAIYPAVTTANRPTGAAVGSSVYDTDLHIPIWFDGTNWRNSAGTVV